MAIREIITANCENGQLSKSKIARQWDDQGTLIQFAGYPEPETDEELTFHLIVWMRASEDAEPVELPPIELEADQWLISNYYTQLPQMLRFQLCIANEAGTYEKHSPIFSGIVDKSLSHNGEGAEIDVIPLFDPYKNYLDELILDAGARVVDTELDETSTHLVENKAVAEAVAAVNGRLHDVEDAIGGEVEVTATFIDGRSIAPSTGGTNTHATSSYSSWISCEEGDTFLVTMPLYTSLNYRGLVFYSAQGNTDAAMRAAYISGIQCNYNASLSEVSFETRRIVVPEGAHFFRTTWFASTETLYSDFSCIKVKEGTIGAEISGVQADLNDVKVAMSGNALDHSTLQSGYAISANGVVSANGSYATTDYIPVREGDVVVLGDGKAHSISIARLCTYNSEKEFISGATANVSSFTVPAGVAFVRLCANNTYFSKPTGRVNLGGVLESYEDYYSGNVNRIAQKNGTNIFNLLHYPLSTLPDCIVKNLAYKPLGELSKGYICLTTDDGGAGVASYTIPMCIDKDVPFTFAMMSASAVLQTAEGLATVKDAVENHGCCIAQHGGIQWTNYDEYGLSAFFDTEKAYWDSVEIPVYGACAPQIQINDWILALAGGRFGCHRGAYQYSAPYYGAYINGPRSNLYNLTSQNIIDSDLGTWKAKCDVTLSNHWLMFIHTHENELTADAKTKLEGVIDYAKQIGLTFVTMKDIPNIT